MSKKSFGQWFWEEFKKTLSELSVKSKVIGGSVLLCLLVPFFFSSNNSIPETTLRSQIQDHSSGISETILRSQIQDRSDDLYYKKSSDKPFSGKMISLWQNGVLESETEIKNGVKQGTQKIYYDTGKIWSITKYKKNEKHGTEVIYLENGQVDKIDWENGVRK